MKLLAFLLFLTLPASAAPTQISTNQIAPGAVTDSRVTLSTGGVTLGKFGDDKVSISTGAVAAGKFDDNKVAITTGGIKGGFNSASQLVQLDATTKLPAVDGSQLTNLQAAAVSGPITVSSITDTGALEARGTVKLGAGITQTTITTGGSISMPPGATLIMISSPTFKGLASFTQVASTQATFSGWDAYGGASANSGLIQLGASNNLSGRLSYDNNNNGIFHIDNDYDNAAGVIKFGLRTSGTALFPLILDPITGGMVYFSNATSTQATAYGYSSYGGASANSGIIKLGFSPTTSATLDFDNGSQILHIDNNYDATSADILFGVRHSGAQLNPLRIAGTGIVTLSSTTKFIDNRSTQAFFSGFSSEGGASTNNGQIKIGGVNDNVGMRLQTDTNNTGNIYLENLDAAPVKICVNGAPAATGGRVCSFSMAGIGDITISSVANFTNARSTQATFTGYSGYSGANVNSGRLRIGGVNYGGVLDYDFTGSGAFRIINPVDDVNTKTSFVMREQGTQIEALKIAGSGAVSIPALNPAATPFLIGTSSFSVNSNARVGINAAPSALAQLQVTQTASTQAVFSGWAPGGNDGNTGTIALGNATTLNNQALIFLDNNRDLVFMNMIDNASNGAIRFKVRGTGTILTPYNISPTGLNTFTNTSTTQVYVNGWAPYSGGNDTSTGALMVGGPSNVGLLLSDDGNRVAHVDNVYDNASTRIDFGMRTAAGGGATPLTPLRIVGDGSVQVGFANAGIPTATPFQVGTTTLIVTSAGLVGINIAPLFGLHVSTAASYQAEFTGGTSYNGGTAGANNGSIILGNASGSRASLEYIHGAGDTNGAVHINDEYGSTAARIRLRANSAQVGVTTLTWTGGGRLGLNVDAPAATLHIGPNVGNPDANVFEIGVSTLIVNSKGLVGINISDPLFALHVSSAGPYQAEFTGGSPQGGASANNGSIIIGNASGSRAHIDYSYTGEDSNGVMTIANEYGDTSARLRFKMNSNVVGQATMTFLGTGRLGINTDAPSADLHIAAFQGAGRTPNATAFQIGVSSLLFSSNGLLTINTAISTQAVFEGYSTVSGASTNHGHIQIGAANTFSGHLDHGTGSTFRIYETDTSGNIQIGLGEPGLAASYPSIKILPNSGTVQILPSAGGPSTSFQVGTSSLVLTSNNQLGLGITTPGAMLVIKATSSTNSQIMEWQKSNGVVFMRSFSDNGLAARSSSAPFHVSDQTYGTDTSVNGAKIGSKVAVISGYADNGITGYGDELALLSVQAFAFGGSQPTGRLFEVKGTTSADITSRSDNFFIRSRGDVMIGDFTNGIDSYGRLGINRVKNTALTDTVHIGGRVDVNPLVVGSAASDDVTVDTMTVSANGVMSLPYQPHAMIEGTSDLTYVGGTVTKIFWTTSRGNTNSLWGGTSSSGTFTAPVAGGYRITCTVEFAAATQAQIRVRVNASGLTKDQNGATNSTAATAVTNDWTRQMSAGDTADCNAFSPSSQTIVSGNSHIEVVKQW